jgi:hypothetical protein
MMRRVFTTAITCFCIALNATICLAAPVHVELLIIFQYGAASPSGPDVATDADMLEVRQPEGTN